MATPKETNQQQPEADLQRWIKGATAPLWEEWRWMRPIQASFFFFWASHPSNSLDSCQKT